MRVRGRTGRARQRDHQPGHARPAASSRFSGSGSCLALGGFSAAASRDSARDLQLHLIDISKQELLDDLSAAEDLHSTGLYRLLVEEAGGTEGETPWAVIAGLYTFDAGACGDPRAGRAWAASRGGRRSFPGVAQPAASWDANRSARSPIRTTGRRRLAPDAEQEWNTLRSRPRPAGSALRCRASCCASPTARIRVDAFPFRRDDESARSRRFPLGQSGGGLRLPHRRIVSRRTVGMSRCGIPISPGCPSTPTKWTARR